MDQDLTSLVTRGASWQTGLRGWATALPPSLKLGGAGERYRVQAKVLIMSRCSTLLLGLVFLLGLVVASAPQIAHASDDFGRFCTEWMGKLAQRERDNLKTAEARAGAGGVVVEYTGYASEPVSCVARIPQPGKPGVGILKYLERRLRRSGPDAARARSSEPAVLSQVEVTELFRFDGKRWIY
jgi:hypothetical protein